MSKPVDQMLRLALLLEWRERCAWCGRPIAFDEMEVEHLLPKSLIGEDNTELLIKHGLPLDYDFEALENLAASCRPCNGRKGRRPPPQMPVVSMLIREANERAPAIRARAEKLRGDRRVQTAAATVMAAAREGDESAIAALRLAAAELVADVRDATGERLTRVHSLLSEDEDGPVANLPWQGRDFVGRQSLLDELRTLVEEDTRRIVVHGLGGIGKTRAVLEFAHAAKPDLEVAWMVPGPSVARAAALADLARALGLPEGDEPDETVALQATYRWLQSHDRWLLVVDDATPDDLIDLPHFDTGHLLITSQQAGGWRHVGRAIRLEVLARDASVALLTAGQAPALAQGADQLAEALGDLPLALAQAAAYVDTTRIGFTDYLTRFETVASELLDRGAPQDHQLTVAATWRIAYEALDGDEPAMVLATLSHLGDGPVPRVLFEAEIPSGSPFSGPNGVVRLDDAITELLRYSLVAADSDSLRTHQLVRLQMRNELDDDAAADYIRLAEFLVESALSFDLHAPDNWDAAATLVAHGLTTVEFAESHDLSDGLTANLLYKVGLFRFARFEFNGARAALERCVALGRVAAPGSAEVGYALFELAKVVTEIEDYPTAIALYGEAIETLQSAGAPTEDVAGVEASLGVVLRRSGDLSGALKRLQEALDHSRLRFAADDPELIKPLVNLANALNDLDQYDRALACLEEAYELAIAHLKFDGPELPVVLSSVGMALERAGSYARAAELVDRAVSEAEAFYGPDHPGLAPFLGNAAVVAKRTRDHQRVVTLLERTVGLDTVAYGDGHPKLLETLMLLATAYADVGDMPASLATADRAMMILRSGVVMTKTARIDALVRFADFQRTVAGDFAASIELSRSAVSLARQALGDRHSSTAFALRTLGVALRQEALRVGSTEILREALDVQMQALRILTAVFGEVSVPVCDTLSNIGNIHCDVANWEVAIDVHRRAMRMAADLYGTDAVSYAQVVAGLANAYGGSGDHLAAEYWAQIAIAIDPTLAQEQPGV